jgi:hypothetical protein
LPGRDAAAASGSAGGGTGSIEAAAAAGIAAAATSAAVIGGGGVAPPEARVAKAEKNWSASFFAVESMRREPSCASFPPTCAFTV